MPAASSHLITDVAKDSGGLSPTPRGTCRDRHVMSERQKRPGKCDLVSTFQAPLSLRPELWSAASASTDPKGNGDPGPV